MALFTKKLNSRQFGKTLEKKAAAFLKKQGLQLLCSNYACKFGELDIVMVDPGQQIVFIEVRYRSNPDFGTALESVGSDKQRKLRRTALHFLQAHPRLANKHCRFDVVAVMVQENTRQHTFQWVRDAFH